MTPPIESGALDRCLADARRAWPDVELDADVFAGHLEQRLAEWEGGPPALEDARTNDLYLACACARGDACAIAHLDTILVAEVNVAAALARVSPEVAADAKQVLREILLVDHPDAKGTRRAALATYRGQADLRGWLRIAAVRELVRLNRREGREVAVDDQALIDALSPGVDPELGYIRDLYRQEAKASFEAALRALPSRERSMLRYQLVDGMTLEEIAALHGVSRATIIRRLAAARQTVLERLRADLGERFGADEGDVDSLLRLVRSRLDVSLETVLATNDPDQ